MDVASKSGPDETRGERPYLVVSGDSHAGPSLERQLRPYCPARYLDDFDAYVHSVRARAAPMIAGRQLTNDAHADALSDESRAAGLAKLARIRENPGSQEPDARLRDMDESGITSELILAGAMNDEELPWTLPGTVVPTPLDRERAAVAGHLWNEWLADFCAASPQRLLGVAQVPIWDVDAAVEEVRWAKEHGLRALNFPAPRRENEPYNEVARYAPFWAAVEEVDLPLVTHAGSGDVTGLSGQGGTMLWLSEVLWLSRRGLGQMVFGGVFDRHPELKLILVEQRANWVRHALGELDGAYFGMPTNGAIALLGAPPEAPLHSPSEYWRSNCFLAASFLAPFEVAERYDIGMSTLMWGSDYPHLEGTWPSTRLAMRNTFAGVPEADVRVILGDNGVRAFGLDRAVLDPVADRIGPTPSELDRPLSPSEIPAYRGYAFRERSAYH